MQDKRKYNWWEPVYNKNAMSLVAADWDFSHCTGKKDAIFSPPENDPIDVRGKVFEGCDFDGDFSNINVKFSNCTFKVCDFGGSEWSRARFSNCIFEMTSFTLSTFIDCEFRDCQFRDILYSGNTTKIEKTLITNPSHFLESPIIFSRNLPTDVSKLYQSAQLNITRSTMARIVLSNVSHEGSERTYYDAIRAATILGVRARHCNNLIKLFGGDRKFGWKHIKFSNFFPFIWCCILYLSGKFEEYALRFLGFLNAWGESIVRSLAFGVGLCFLFAYFYYCMGVTPSYRMGFVRALEITFLFGYTNHVKLPAHLPQALDMIWFTSLINALCGLLWYAVTIPTIVNKLTRVR